MITSRTFLYFNVFIWVKCTYSICICTTESDVMLKGVKHIRVVLQTLPPPESELPPLHSWTLFPLITHFPLSLPSTWQCFCFLHLWFDCCISSRWNHTSFLWLAYFTQHNVHRVHMLGSEFPSFSRLDNASCLTSAPFAYLVTLWWKLGLWVMLLLWVCKDPCGCLLWVLLTQKWNCQMAEWFQL